MTDFVTPAHHSEWQPTDLHFAAQPSGKALEGEDGSIIELSNGQFYGLMADLAEDATIKAEAALSRIGSRTQASATIDVSNADDEPEPEVDADDISLALWEADQ